MYPPPPHCNASGLTSLGAYLIDKMIQQHFIVELDHMDAKTADATLSILEAHHYSGVISAHSWDSPEENPGSTTRRVRDADRGRLAASFIDQWKTSLTIRDKRFYGGTGFGYGADMNGLAEQSQPTPGRPISYPFRSYDGQVTFTRELWGQRTFDLNKDGVANYGMYADWLQELQHARRPAALTDMFHGAEAYLEMWERAYGVPATGGCLAAGSRLSARGLGPARLGLGSRNLLMGAGQPAARPGRSFGLRERPPGSRLPPPSQAAERCSRLVASSAPRALPGRLHPGARAPRPARLARSARALGHGLWLGRRLSAGTHLLYRIGSGRVAWVGAVTAADGRRPAQLRSDAGAAGLR